MTSNIIDAVLLKKMFLSGATNLQAKKEWINELNVFPVPDGDTGTNMTMTIMSAAKEVGSIEEPTMELLAKAISSGSLRGARGNSGVILSQLFRGFTKVIKPETEINISILSEALQKATETAYKAVIKPKEGTILTVAKGISDKAAEISEAALDMETFISELIKEGDRVLNLTPEMLPVLKQAGVVDSGGQGLMQVLKGAYDAFLGKEFTIDIDKADSSSEGYGSARTDIETADIKFGYCTEFIIMLSRQFNHADEKEFVEYLSSIGDSIVCVADDELVKVHVHTNDPGLAIQRALTYGQLTRMKIDNMRDEHHERVIKNAQKVAQEQKEERIEEEAPQKEYGFISVSAGSGLSEIFKGLGIDYIIEGGQTMNPSTEDMLTAIKKVNAKAVFILPNNSNIIMAANQAKDLVEDREIYVIPTKTIPQGITAAINFAPDRSMQENAECMTESIKSIRTGQVTYAVRDTVIDDVEIHKDDIIGLGDKHILADGKDITEVAYQTIVKMIDDDSELISIYYGKDVDEKAAQELSEKLASDFPMIDIEVNEGGQPIYYYILSVE